MMGIGGVAGSTIAASPRAWKLGLGSQELGSHISCLAQRQSLPDLNRPAPYDMTFRGIVWVCWRWPRVGGAIHFAVWACQRHRFGPEIQKRRFAGPSHTGFLHGCTARSRIIKQDLELCEEYYDNGHEHWKDKSARRPPMVACTCKTLG